MKNATPQALLGQVAKQTFHHVEPGGTGRGGVHVKAGMALQPAPHLGMFVGRIVVGNDVNLFVLGRLLVDLAQEREPILVCVAGAALTQHLAVQNVESSE